MPFVVVIERPTRGLDSPPNVSIIGVEVELKIKNDIAHALNQVERKGYVLCAVLPLGESGSKYVFATKGSFFEQGSASADTSLTPYEQSLLTPESVSVSRPDESLSAPVPPTRSKSPATIPAPTALSVSGRVRDEIRLATMAASSPGTNASDYTREMQLSHGPVTVSHTVSAEKKAATYQFRIQIEKNPDDDWTMRDPTIVLELSEAMVHFDLAGAKSLKEHPNTVSLKSFWHKHQKKEVPYQFPEKGGITENCAQKIAKAMSSSGGQASAVKVNLS